MSDVKSIALRNFVLFQERNYLHSQGPRDSSGAFKETAVRPVVVFSCGLLALLSFGCAGSSTPPAQPTNPTAPTAPATPTVTSITPSKVEVGSGHTNVTVAGTGFLSSSIVKVGGVAEQTVFDSSTELTATIPATQSSVGAELPIAVFNGTVSSSNTPALNL